MDACTGKQKHLSKTRLTLLLIFYITLSVYLTSAIKESTGFYGFQDARNYEREYETFRYEITHWATIWVMDVFGFQMWPIILTFILLPKAFILYYSGKGLDGYEKTMQLYLYSPLILLLLHENIYSQLFFTLFFVLYLTYKKPVYQLLGILCHPAFITLFVVEIFLQKKYKIFIALLIFGVGVFLMFPTYQNYHILNLGLRDEMFIGDVLLYMNPINILTLPYSFYNLIYTLVGVTFHNGRFMLYAVMLQYLYKISTYGKIYGLIINFSGLYYLFSHL